MPGPAGAAGLAARPGPPGRGGAGPPGRGGPPGRKGDVVLAVARGRSNAEIAAEPYVSATTVKTHLSHAMAKLGLTNRTQLALLAHDAGLV